MFGNNDNFSVFYVRGILFIIVIGSILFAIFYDKGPAIDPTQVVNMQELRPMALNCFTYTKADHREWPSGLNQRTYICFMQDKGLRFAFQLDEDGVYSALVGFIDSLRLRGLYQEAKESGIAVPGAAFTSKFDN